MTTTAGLAILQWDDVFKGYNVFTDVDELDILGDFLTSDCRCFGIDRYYQWALNPDKTRSGSNLTYIHKTEHGLKFASDINNAEPPYLYLSPDNFIEILDAWKKIVESMPHEVHLIMENGRVRLEVIKQ
jgi:hypothetical protein